MVINIKTGIGIIAIILLLILVIIWIKDIPRLEEENHQLQIYILSMEEFYKEIKDKIEETRKYRHDLAKHIQTMEQLLITYHGGPTLQESVKKMKHEFSRMGEQQYSNNELIDIICQIKKRECESRGIRFVVEIGGISFLPVSEMDMVGLMQNLLDNGIEACEQVEEKNEKEIVLTIHQLEDGLEMTVKNTCDTRIPIDFRTRKRRKEEHGFGMKIIREIVNKVQGELRYSSGKGYVTAYVFLPINGKKMIEGDSNENRLV